MDTTMHTTCKSISSAAPHTSKQQKYLPTAYNTTTYIEHQQYALIHLTATIANTQCAPAAIHNQQQYNRYKMTCLAAAKQQQQPSMDSYTAKHGQPSMDSQATCLTCLVAKFPNNQALFWPN
jgi:hypothetical protein